MTTDRQRQLLRELNATAEGADRYLNGLDQMERRKKLGDAGIAKSASTPFVEAIAAEVAKLVEDAKKVRRKPVAAKALAEANPYAVATLTCSAIMSFTGLRPNKEDKYTNFSNAMGIFVGKRVDQERMQETLFTENREWFTQLHARNLTDGEWVKALEHISDMPTLTAWTPAERLQIGLTLLAFAENAGFIVQSREPDTSGNMVIAYDLSPAVMDNMAELMDIAAQAKPVLKPMVCKPKPWTLDDDGNVTGGGYLTIKKDLVKRNVSQG